MKNFTASSIVAKIALIYGSKSKNLKFADLILSDIGCHAIELSACDDMYLSGNLTAHNIHGKGLFARDGKKLYVHNL